MIEKVKISYRDFDYSSFDINNRDVEQENEYKALLSQAYKASPQNATEKEILDDYIRTLKEIIAYYFEINEIRSMIQELQSDAMQDIEDLKNTAAQKAACIYSREQDLSVIRSLGSNALVKMLERSNDSRKPKTQGEMNTNYMKKLFSFISSRKKTFFVLTVICVVITLVSVIGFEYTDSALSNFFESCANVFLILSIVLASIWFVPTFVSIIQYLIKKCREKKNQNRVLFPKKEKLRFCKYCGVKIDEDSRFCQSCGKN